MTERSKNLKACELCGDPTRPNRLTEKLCPTCEALRVGMPLVFQVIQKAAQWAAQKAVSEHAYKVPHKSKVYR